MSHFDVPDGGISLNTDTETTALLQGVNSDSVHTDKSWIEPEEEIMMTSNIGKDKGGGSGKYSKDKPERKYDDGDTTTDIDGNLGSSEDEFIPEYIPTSYKSDMNCYRGDSAFCLFVWIAIPLLFFMCTLLPFDFSLFLPANIATLEEDGVKSYELRLFLNKNNGYGLNIYPDLLIYYIIFMLVCNISYLSRKSLWFRIEMRKIRFFIPRGNSSILIKQGEWLLWAISFIFLCIWALYWIFIYDGYDNTLSEYKWLQRVAMGIGKCSMLCLSLALFPITRNSNIWNTVFHTSYEHMIRFHKFFSYLFLILSCIHLLLWVIYFSIAGMLSTNIIFGPVPYTYNKRNFTIPAMYYVFIFIIAPIFFGFAYSAIRRQKYELFYYSHIIGSFIVVTMVVWHAKSAWYYVIPPVILYVIDQLMLMIKSTRIAHIKDIKSLPDPRYVQLTVSMDEIFKSEVYEASIDVYNKSLSNKEKKLFPFGQYFWLNIPSISAYQWHPICVVNSSFYKKECTFIIQKKESLLFEADKEISNEGNENEWCEQVVKLGESGNNEERNKVLNRMMEIKLDGPYGEPIIIDAYRKILIVVGGIGFVSYISFFQYMLKRAIRDETQISVDLVWLCKDPKIYLAFKSILREYSARFDNDPERLFDIRLFHTQRVPSSQVSEIESSIQLSLEFGRPNLIKELSYIEGLGTFTLVMASGPPSLLQATQRVAVRFGAHYRQESFVL